MIQFPSLSILELGGDPTKGCVNYSEKYKAYFTQFLSANERAAVMNLV
ncbi:hypothetical protein [Acidianus sp. RZ1]|nr:hypothetical protein [Acidianus sp. RZ1]NON61270.1 hypothetical protein [Acidianus sp. RZ1]